MNRKNRRKHKSNIERSALSFAARLVKLDVSYNKVRSEMEGLAGDDPIRQELNKKAERLLLQYEKVKAQYKLMDDDYGLIKQEGKMNFEKFTVKARATS